MNQLTLLKKMLNMGYGVKYKIKNNTVARKEALTKLNKQPIEVWMDSVIDVVAKTSNGLYVSVKPCRAGIKIKYQGALLVDRNLLVYWDKYGSGLSVSSAVRMDVKGFDISEIVDFTPIVKDDEPRVKAEINNAKPCPDYAFKGCELNEQHIEQIRRNIRLLDQVLSKPVKSQ